jgi:hypothetical protein
MHLVCMLDTLRSRNEDFESDVAFHANFFRITHASIANEF